MTVVQSIKQRLARSRRRLEQTQAAMRISGPDDALGRAASAKAHHAVIQELEDLLEELHADRITTVGILGPT